MILIVGRPHDLAAYQRGCTRDARNRLHLGGQCLKLFDSIIKPTTGAIESLFIDRHMRVSTQDCINKFRAKAAAHSQHNNQSSNRKGDANQADPGHRTDAAFSTFGPKIAPSN